MHAARPVKRGFPTSQSGYQKRVDKKRDGLLRCLRNRACRRQRLGLSVRTWTGSVGTSGGRSRGSTWSGRRGGFVVHFVYRPRLNFSVLTDDSAGSRPAPRTDASAGGARLGSEQKVRQSTHVHRTVQRA